MLIISNADVARLLTMGDAIDALDQAYRQLVTTGRCVQAAHRHA
jgi:hypothetical protein